MFCEKWEWQDYVKYRDIQHLTDAVTLGSYIHSVWLQCHHGAPENIL